MPTAHQRTNESVKINYFSCQFDDSRTSELAVFAVCLIMPYDCALWQIHSSMILSSIFRSFCWESIAPLVHRKLDIIRSSISFWSAYQIWITISCALINMEHWKNENEQKLDFCRIQFSIKSDTTTTTKHKLINFDVAHTFFVRNIWYMCCAVLYSMCIYHAFIIPPLRLIYRD